MEIVTSNIGVYVDMDVDDEGIVCRFYYAAYGNDYNKYEYFKRE